MLLASLASLDEVQSGQEERVPITVEIDVQTFRATATR